MTDPVELTLERLREMPLPSPDEDGDKDARGRVLVVAGSREVPGAAVLAGISSLRAGAGKLQIATVASAALPMAHAAPEARVIGLEETEAGEIDAGRAGEALRQLARNCDALLIGPGMMDDAAALGIVTELSERSLSCGIVLDAAALCALDPCREKLANWRGRLVITPHAGEMAKLLDCSKEAVLSDPLAAAREASSRYGAIVVMKGRETHIVAPDGTCWLNRGGDIGLATSGSGDTLAGLITGLLARGAPPPQATAWGVYVHAQAGSRLGATYGGIGYIARELPEQFSRVLNDLSAQSDP